MHISSVCAHVLTRTHPRENEKEGQGAKVVVICKEVADWGKGVSCGAFLFFCFE